MIHRYDLTSMVDRPKGTVVTLPPIFERLGTVKAYRKALRELLSGLADEVRDGIIPLYAAEAARTRSIDGYTVDAASWWFDALNALAGKLAGIATRTVNRILRLEAERHSDEFMAAAKRALGIDIKAVVTQEVLADYLDAAALRNASLIKGLSDDTVKRVTQTVVEGHLNGQSVRDLRARLKADFGIADKRAALIAQDQTAKLNSDLNRIRQGQAGVTSYEWHTSRDERVRERHRKLDGTVYKWGEPTGAEEGLPPGKPIRCRCVALGKVEF